MDTVDANRALGLPDDSREYFSVRNILDDLGVKSIRLIVSQSSFHRLPGCIKLFNLLCCPECRNAG
jgi:GTP cyclohydrolase II